MHHPLPRFSPIKVQLGVSFLFYHIFSCLFRSLEYFFGYIYLGGVSEVFFIIQTLLTSVVNSTGFEENIVYLFGLTWKQEKQKPFLYNQDPLDVGQNNGEKKDIF